MQTSISLRQIPIVVAPPTLPKPGVYTSLTSQPSSSLNYWWPYGSNGVNPTITPTPSSVSYATSTVDTAYNLTSETTSTERTTTSASSSPAESASTTTPAISLNTSIPPPSSGPQGFRVISLLPLFVILGVIALATLIGWTYGRCARWCERRKEPTSGGPDIGRGPYEFGCYDPYTAGPMRRTGMGWVDASRIYDYNVSSVGIVRVRRHGEEPGTPSKNKSRSYGPGWFRHTFSKKMAAKLTLPSTENGSSCPSVQDYGWLGSASPAAYTQLTSHQTGFSLPPFGSPRTLRIVNDLPANLDMRGQSPLTSSQPTPSVSASRHGSLRRKILSAVQTEDKEELVAAPIVSGTPPRPKNVDNPETNWTDHMDAPLQRAPARRFKSSNGPTYSRVPAGPPDPPRHRDRMHRLRVAAETRTADSENVTSPPTAKGDHSLLPGSSAVLSPPLRARLFFDGTFSKGDGPERARCPSLERIVSSPNDGDPFNPCTTPARCVTRSGETPSEAPKSSPTTPLSPELRGTAMTRFEEIVKTSWSTRNLAGIPQSPTMFGALSP